MSLSDRMEARAAELQGEQTETFDLPGWEGIIAIELKSLGYGAIRTIQKRNERERNATMREVYNMADQIIAATMGFKEVKGSEETPIEDSWITLAQRRKDCPDGATPRIALLFLLDGDKRVHYLYTQWIAWASGITADIEEEVGRDFSRTE